MRHFIAGTAENVLNRVRPAPFALHGLWAKEIIHQNKILWLLHTTLHHKSSDFFQPFMKFIKKFNKNIIVRSRY